MKAQPRFAAGWIGLLGDILLLTKLLVPSWALLGGKEIRPYRVPQKPMAPRTDLRDMLRQEVIRRSLAEMEQARQRRQAALAPAGDLGGYVQEIRRRVRGFYGLLPAGPEAPPVRAREVSRVERAGFRVENVLFESFPGWEVNASVYVPRDDDPPFPAVVVPVGHSGKQFEDYQRPCQYFARAGYLAITFDPPGQAGEKQPGNDHFRDGVRCYLVGETSSRYFVADALRCLDYLATRPDCDLSRGVAMTGVSGGGTTTTFAALLDDRIAVLGPSCCVTELADLDITQCYAGCPETHPWRRYAEGIDEVDLLCAALPKPTLLMAGEQDEVFRIEDTRRLAETLQRFYAQAGVPERFSFFVDRGKGHCYSLDQAREFVRFMNRWLRNEPDRSLPACREEDFPLLSPEELQCHPRTDVNMRTLTLDRARELQAIRDERPEAVRRAAAQVAQAQVPSPVPESEVGDPFLVWTHHWRSVMLRPEPGIELPATWLSPASEGPAPLFVHFDDQGRHRLIERGGPLLQAIHFLEGGAAAVGLLSVDLRGWGDTAPAVYPYELAGWGGVDRYLAYATAALGDPVLAMRIRDALAALAWARQRPEVQGERLVLSGCGLGGVVALHAAVVDGGVVGVVIWDALIRFRSLLETADYTWPADAFLPNVLQHYDLPALANAAPCPVYILAPRDGQGQWVSEAALSELQSQAGQHVHYILDGGWPERLAVLRKLTEDSR